MANSCMHGAVKVMHLIHGFSCYFHFQEKQHRRPFLRWMWKLMYFRPHQIRPCWAGLTQVNGLNVLITLFAAWASASTSATQPYSPRPAGYPGYSTIMVAVSSNGYPRPPSSASAQVDIFFLPSLHLFSVQVAIYLSDLPSLHLFR